MAETGPAERKAESCCAWSDPGSVTYAAGRERNMAMGVRGGLAGLGGTLGVVAGGVLVDAAAGLRCSTPPR